jgi:hypothetical protein
MLVAIAKPHQQFPVPLTVADYEFSTSDDGDERGRVTLPPDYARSGVMTQIGDELIVYCTQLSKTIWRGQIERIEEAKDESITWHALGFGALQRDARISVVRNMSDMTHWQPVGSGFMPNSGYDSRGDLWEYGIISSAGVPQIQIRTKSTFFISASMNFFVAYLYNQPERYVSITSNERLSITSLSFTGLASGVWVLPVTNIPTPNSYTLTLGALTVVSAPSNVSTSPPCYGWVIGVTAFGNETTAGATSVTFRATVNASTSNGISDGLLTIALSGRGGCCDVYLPDQTNVRIEKSDANLREIVEQSTDDFTQVRYHRKRFFRDGTLPTIDFRSDSPLTWRFPETTRVVDISKAPNRIYGQYRGYWTNHLTATTSILSLESRRQQLAWRVASVGEYSSKAIAEARRDEAATALDRQIAPLTVELDNSRYELMTREGCTVPNWSADVSDYAIVPGYYRNAKITARTISRDRTTYTVSFDPDDFVSVLR